MALSVWKGEMQEKVSVGFEMISSKEWRRAINMLKAFEWNVMRARSEVDARRIRSYKNNDGMRSFFDLLNA